MKSAKKSKDNNKPTTADVRIQTDPTIGQVQNTISFIPPSLSTDRFNDQDYPNTNSQAGNKYPLSWEFIS